MKTNWQAKKLGDLCDVITKGTTPTSVGYKFMSNGINFIKVESISTEGKFKFNKFAYISNRCHEALKRSQLKENDILFSIAGALGRTAVVIKDIIPANTNQALAIVRLKKSNEFYRDFILLALNSGFTLEQIKKAKGGVAQQNLSLSQISNFQIPLPPLTEQKRIVKILDKAFEKIEKAKKNTEKNLQNTKELFESYLQNIFANPGNDWKEKRLGDIGKVSMCKRIFKEQTLTIGDIPFYKIGTFGKKPNAYISNKIYNEYRNKFSFPKKGDILLSASGTIGRRVKYDGKPAYFQDSNIVWINNDEKQVLNEYLYHFYGNCKWNTTKGATIARLYNDNLKRIKITFPKSLVQQGQIVKRLDELSAKTKRLETIYQQKLDNFAKLKKSILQQAFEGKI